MLPFTKLLQRPSNLLNIWQRLSLERVVESYTVFKIPRSNTFIAV